MFTLGRELCNQSAAMLRDVHLLSNKESKYVTDFYKQCISNLRREDQKLAQVSTLLTCLVHGVGIHHAGLLPLLKEIVEMLFTAGYIKILFATETFAIGVNMPAKAVVFSGMCKFDAKERRYFRSSE